MKSSHQLDVGAAGERHALVACVGHAAVGLVDDTDARIFGGVFVEDRGRIIMTAVVKRNELEIAVFLPNDAVDAASQRAGGIVDRHDDADGWGGWGDSSG